MLKQFFIKFCMKKSLEKFEATHFWKFSYKKGKFPKDIIKFSKKNKKFKKKN